MSETRKTILVVDDDKELVRAASEILREENFRVLEATDPETAVKIAAAYEVDLLLLDLHMPKLNGFEVLKLAREKQPDVKVIIISGYLEQHKSDLRKIQYDDFIRKPADPEVIFSSIRQLIGPEKPPAGCDPNAPFPSAKILIVDDEPDVGILLRDNMLEAKFGDFQIELAENGSDALDKAAVFEPDIVVVDIKMPHMWGDELIERMKAMPTPRPKGFFVLTAVSDEKLESRMRREGHIYVKKPFNQDILFEKIRAKCLELNLVKKPAQK
ncbi:MAG: response regulator [Candidatus Omnitrophica bacterium]|nr:response regulator [Candidatus Omnitrophota bacterium]